MVLINPRINKAAQHDAAAAIENMILTAVSKGIGSCWVGSVDRQKLRQILQIPEHFKIDSVLALGYPDEKPVAEEMKDSIKYYEDKNGQLHVPQRKLKDILYQNRYGSTAKE